MGQIHHEWRKMKAAKAMLSILALFGLSGCATIPQRGAVYYTTANIWYTDPRDIRTTNYHEGAMIPFGSKVTIESLNPRGLRFKTANDITFYMTYMSQHSAITMKEHFDRYFSVDDPAKSGSQFDGFNDMEKENIREGNVSLGMSKAAVLAAYGYPPSHRTPDLNADFWRYWTKFRQEAHVLFEDGKVVKLEKLAVVGPPPGLKKLTSVSSLSE